jgi:chromosome partitioning protein
MAEVIAVVSQKGGVGKTTTVANLGAALAREGQRVLLLEVDPQGALAPSFGLNGRELTRGLLDVLRGEAAVGDAIAATSIDGLSLLPAVGERVDELALEQLLALQPTQLREVLGRLEHRFDAILIDGSPTLGALTVATLIAADSYLVPVQAEEFSYRTLGRMLSFAAEIQLNYNPGLRCLGLLVTMADLRTKMAVRVINELHENYGDKVLMSMVPRMVALSEMPLRGAPAVIYAEQSKGAQAYREVALEILLELQQGELDAEESAGITNSRLIDDIVGEQTTAVRERSAAPFSLDSLRGLNPELLLTAFHTPFDERLADAASSAAKWDRLDRTQASPDDEDLSIH